jgi:UDP-N-acetylmuramyl pentapeptide phosphotransferase/UDP-N-acetylglucosamine-1-phosphate transferase
MSRKNAELQAELANIARGAANPRPADQKASTVRKTPTLGPLAVLLGLVVLSVAAGPLLSVFGNAQYIALGVVCVVLFGAVFAYSRSHRDAYIARMQAAGMSELEAYQAYNARYGD